MFRRAAQRGQRELYRLSLPPKPTIQASPIQTLSVAIFPGDNPNIQPAQLSSRATWNHPRTFSTGPSSKDAASTAPKPSNESMSKRRFADDINEYKERVASGSTADFDAAAIPKVDASSFPRIKTTSLSTKRIVIADSARKKAATLVMVAFRSFADDQLQSWKNAFMSELPTESVQYYDVTINESFASQALSGFIQRLQRGRTDPALHDYHVAFNSRAREPLEDLLPSRNRIFGYVLLLDRDGRVRFRASGMASSDGLEALLSASRQVLTEDAANAYEATKK